MNLRETFDMLTVPSIEHLVSTHQQEHLNLDFKVITGAGDLSKDDRRNLATAISGFANSDGGIVIWGVDCRRDASGRDAAEKVVPVRDAQAVLSRLQSLTGESTSPIVEGVHHRLITNDDTLDFLATLIPASDRGPHMARLGGVAPT